MITVRRKGFIIQDKREKDGFIKVISPRKFWLGRIVIDELGGTWHISLVINGNLLRDDQISLVHEQILLAEEALKFCREYVNEVKID